MALRIQIAKLFLSDANLIKSKSPFCTTAISRSEMDDLVNMKDQVAIIDPIKEGGKLPYAEQRKLDDDLVPHIQENLSYLGGVPQEHVVERLARIAPAPKSAMQSGTDNTHVWILQFDNRQRWENNLMGWVSSGDPLSNLQLRFNTSEEAVEYCKKYRYPYFIEKEKPIAPKKKSYAHNFSWNKRTRASTK